MDHMSPAQIEKAYAKFRVNRDIPSNFQSTLKGARLAQQLSMSMAATRLGISKSAYDQLEKSDAREGISLRQLKRAAQALESFGRALWNKLLPFALSYPAMRNCPDHLRVGRLAAVAVYDCLPNPEIRRRLGWARKNFVQWPRYLHWNRLRWPFTVQAGEMKHNLSCIPPSS